MAKRRVTATAAPDHLTMQLFAPGMTALHRAGLGGLTCTLRYIERAYEEGRLSDDEVPGGPWDAGKPPWDIDEQSVTLRFGQPEQAGELLKRLFGLAFQTRDGTIYLPGQYATEPNQAVRADLQLGLTLTFLQHGRARDLAKTPTLVQHDPDGNGVPGVTVEFKECQWFKHQSGWEEFVDKAGVIDVRPKEVSGPLNPGAVVRHVAFTADTKIEDIPTHILPLYFAIVGCLALPVNRGVAALLVPDVEDLAVFAAVRPYMTPTAVKECLIANAADAALQAQVRLRGKTALRTFGLPGCHAMTFMKTAWASQQKSRVATMHIPPGDEQRLDRFAVALAKLPPKVVTRTSETKAGRGKKKAATQRIEVFRVDSVVRPLVAENLALGRPWYAGFSRLMTVLDPNGKPIRDKLSFERKGLHDMTNTPILWDHDGEAAVVQAVHEALRCRYGMIADENKTKPVAMKKRFAGEYDRWRLAFAGSKTADQFRTALCDLFSRGGNNRVLREAWRQVLPMIDSRRWQLARDLALLALASYSGRGAESDTSPADDKQQS